MVSRALSRITRRSLRDHPAVLPLFEPFARNTAAAVAWASAHVAAADPGGVVGVFPADHYIPDRAAFARTIRAAASVAGRGEALVLIGIEPTRPDTAYGYLRLAKAGSGPARRVERFVEKPDASGAKRLLRSGRCLWNAGMVMATADRILAECEAHAPEVWRGLGPALRAIAAGRRVSREALETAYRKVRPISFDRAVLERTRRAFAVRGQFAWSDLGSWDALGEHLPVVARNRVRASRPPVTLDASENLIWNATGKEVALLGVEGLVVVETQDALLICAQDRAQDVRAIVDQLKRRRRENLT